MPTQRVYLDVRFDVTHLTEAERDCLAGEVLAQAEHSDADEYTAGHPDVSAWIEGWVVA